MTLSAPNVWESLIVRILPKLLFRMQNTPENHHVFLVTLRLKIFEVRPMCKLRFPLPGYKWLSWVGLPGTDYRFPRIPMLQYVTAAWSPSPCPAVYDSGPLIGCNYWLVKQGLSLFPFHSGSLTNWMSGLPTAQRQHFLKASVPEPPLLTWNG